MESHEKQEEIQNSAVTELCCGNRLLSTGKCNLQEEQAPLPHAVAFHLKLDLGSSVQVCGNLQSFCLLVSGERFVKPVRPPNKNVVFHFSMVTEARTPMCPSLRGWAVHREGLEEPFGELGMVSNPCFGAGGMA
jgi:hypothetical protein